LVLACLAFAGCQVRTVVTVDVEDDGSGTVEVAVGLDEEALGRVPDLDDNGATDQADLTQLVRVEDLTATGWEVSEPETEDGTTWFRIHKPFGTPEECNQILAELTGPEGALRDFDLSRSSGFGRDSFELTGTVDLSAGLEAFGDEGLAAALDGEPLGEDAAAIEQRLGAPLTEMVTFELDVTLPGAESSWTPQLGEGPVEVAADSTTTNMPVFLLAGVALLCILAIPVFLLVRFLRR
jgi:hypothetical protein